MVSRDLVGLCFASLWMLLDFRIFIYVLFSFNAKLIKHIIMSRNIIFTSFLVELGDFLCSHGT
jgi:hypothetical protein